ncbi:hypothetical protein ACFWP7_04935 [Streptomyces sp. NPDC058470]|uniref:hypothetical protein n=1 Tax=Streptomyces sp. NPDC058470 TaxID=3346515 RepID=UPI00364A9136
MPDIPPRPDYPPYYASPPEPTTVHVHVTQDEPRGPGWDFSWMQIGRNSKAIAVSLVTAPCWAAALRDVHREQHLAGAWFMAFAALGTAILFDHARQRFVTRAIAWTAALGAVEALPVFTAFVHAMTGSAS